MSNVRSPDVRSPDIRKQYVIGVVSGKGGVAGLGEQLEALLPVWTGMVDQHQASRELRTPDMESVFDQ